VTDRSILYSTAALRSVATGLTGVFLGIHLGRLGLEAGAIGGVVGAGLAGGATAAIVVTMAGDRVGRRRFLLVVSLVGAAGAVAAAALSGPVAFAVAAFVGMLNGMGRDRGAALILEHAILPGSVPDSERTRSFAVYNVVQDLGHAAGALLGGLPALLDRIAAVGPVASGRALLLLVAVLTIACAPLYSGLSSRVELASERRRALTAASRRTLLRISGLFALDGLGSGFLPTALLSYFFFERFGASPATIAFLFFVARLANAGSHLLAAWLSRRIGLVNTMVFTHIPSSLLLATVAFAPNFLVAALLFILREGLVEMDVPTRQSYVMAIVKPEERTVASGLTNLVRMAAWAVAPPIAGLLMQRVTIAVPLLIGAAVKISYDAALYSAFRSVKPPEET
jgi:MFS family permease